MKKIERLFVAGTMALAVAGLTLTPAVVSYAADKAVESPAKEQGYVASAGGEKYHTAACRMAKKIKAENRALYASKAEAQQAGKTPCGICKP